VRPVVIVIVLPLFQLRVEEVSVVRNPVAIEELVELLIVDPMTDEMKRKSSTTTVMSLRLLRG
jgi:hypothetical protein